MTQKTHYRKVFKSDHLGVADLEEMIEQGIKLIFTIKEVKSHYLDVNIKGSGVVVAGRRIGANIAYFKEKIKPLVLNSTNSKIVKSFNKIEGTSKNSPFVEDWSNTLIELFIDSNVKMKGEVVGGVRIRPTQPIARKPELTPKHNRWDDAKKAVSEGKESGVLSQFTISETNLKLLRE